MPTGVLAAYQVLIRPTTTSWNSSCFLYSTWGGSPGLPFRLWYHWPLGNSRAVLAREPFLPPIKWFLPPLHFSNALYPVQLLLPFCEFLSSHSKLKSLKTKTTLSILPNRVWCLEKQVLGDCLKKYIMWTHMLWDSWAHFSTTFSSDERLNS